MARQHFIVVEGYREVDRALRKVDKDKDKAFRREFAEAGQHVADAFKQRIARYGGAKTETVVSKALAKGVFVVQNASKVTGKRGDYGRLQMFHLVDARDENIDKTIAALEEAMDDVIDGAGF